MRKLSLEDYIRDQARIEEPEEVEDQPELPRPAAFAGSGPLTESDRDWLKRLRNEPGYLVLFRLFNNIVQRFETSATVLSTGDPLGNEKAVMQAWAYAAVAKGIKEQLEKEISVEISKI